jgi:hypothetical protein
MPTDWPFQSPGSAEPLSPTDPIPKSPLVPAIATQCPPRGGGSGMTINELGLAARDGPIREANQDRRAK